MFSVLQVTHVSYFPHSIKHKTTTSFMFIFLYLDLHRKSQHNISEAKLVRGIIETKSATKKQMDANNS